VDEKKWRDAKKGARGMRSDRTTRGPLLSALSSERLFTTIAFLPWIQRTFRDSVEIFWTREQIGMRITVCSCEGRNIGQQLQPCINNSSLPLKRFH